MYIYFLYVQTIKHKQNFKRIMYIYMSFKKHPLLHTPPGLRYNPSCQKKFSYSMTTTVNIKKIFRPIKEN